MSENNRQNQPEVPALTEEELKARLEELVLVIRKNSQHGELTKLSQLAWGEELAEEQRKELEDRILELPELEQISNRSGEVYLYSTNYMVQRYAQMILQREENDPHRLVAETIREESKLYPRPTSPEIFTLPPFRIAQEVLATILDELVADSGEYSDIQESIASDGTRYLYSAKYLEKGHADYLAEWYAVGQYENQ